MKRISFIGIAVAGIMGLCGFLLQGPPSGGGGGGLIACDQGPAYTSTVPAPAQAAQFTHCVLNADFASTTTDANGINWSDTSTWLPECGAPARQYGFHLLYDFGPNGFPAFPSAPCNHATIITDSDGTKALDLVYTNADWTAGHNGTGGRFLNLDYPALWNSGDPSPAPFPFEYYWEITYRITPTSLVINNPTTGFQPLATWNIGWGNNPYMTSPDQMETRAQCTSPCTTALQGWRSFYAADQVPAGGGEHSFSGINGNSGPSWDNFDQYHTWGKLLTSDASTTISLCAYRDAFNSPLGCYGIVSNPGADPYYSTRNSTVSISVGDSSCVSTGSTCQVNDVHVVVKSMRLWACDAYKTQNCPGNVKTN